MAKYYYNGVLLPEIPSDVLAENPYCWLALKSDGVTYRLVCGKYFWYYTSATMYTTSHTYSEYKATVNSESFEFVASYTDNGAYPVSNGLVWANHDIFTSSTTTYFESTEPTPEVAEDVSWYQIKASTLTGIADSIREKTGKTDAIMVSQMASEIGGITTGGDLPTDTLVGLENGYDVMFYDENNEGLAFYSIKQGHAINPPVYNCKSWQTSDGVNVTFPYTPSADAIFYALNSTYADQLYEYYGVDKAVYPYVFIELHHPYGEYIYTDLSFNKIMNSEISFSKSRNKSLQVTGDFASLTDIEKILEWVMTTIPPTDLGSDVYNGDTLELNANYIVLTNYEFTQTSSVKTYYSLNE